MSTDNCHIKTENYIVEEILVVQSANTKEANWETNADADEIDPLKIDEDIANGAIIKFEKDTLPKIEVCLKEEPPSEDNSGISFAQNNTFERCIRTPASYKRYICDVCDTPFQTPSLLKIHKRRHTGERPYSCDICGKSFTSLSNFTRHKKSHTGERPHSCGICGKSYTVKYNLKEHIRIHYKSSFPQRNVLTDHSRIQIESKPISCDICSKSFSLRGELNEHMKVHARNSPKNTYPVFNPQIVRILKEACDYENGENPK